MLRIAFKYAGIVAVALVFFSVLRVLVMTDVLRFDVAVTVTAALFAAVGIAFGIRFNGVTANPNAAPPEIKTQRVAVETVLSKRELEVFERLLQNKTNQQICDAMFIEMSTLKTHINRIYKKLGVTNRRQLLAQHGAAAAPPVENAGHLPVNSQA